MALSNQAALTASEDQLQPVTSSLTRPGDVTSDDDEDFVDYEEVEEEVDPDAVLSSVLAPKQQYSWATWRGHMTRSRDVALRCSGLVEGE